jgi:CelD/BcsL family acetyltransferase involved in cellulose biosynthesis
MSPPVIEVDPAVDMRWARLTERPGVQLFASPRWARVLQKTYGMETRALLTERDGEPESGLPFARVSDLRGRRVATLPFSDFCDPIATEAQQWDRLVTPLLAERATFQIRCLHSPFPRNDIRFSEVGAARWHIVDLADDADTQWGLVSGSARRAVRSARKHGLETRVGTSREELRSFYELHLGVRKNKYRLVAQPYRFFEAIWDEFFRDGSGRIVSAVHGDQMVAGILLLEWQGTWYYKFNASDPEWLARRPNDLIMWRAIEEAIRAGVTRLDLGLSDLDQEGLLRYKDKYAKTSGEITTMRHVPLGVTTPALGRLWGSTLRTSTRLLTAPRTPIGLTELGGNVLYRYFA